MKPARDGLTGKYVIFCTRLERWLFRFTVIFFLSLVLSQYFLYCNFFRSFLNSVYGCADSISTQVVKITVQTPINGNISVVKNGSLQGKLGSGEDVYVHLLSGDVLEIDARGCDDVCCVMIKAITGEDLPCGWPDNITVRGKLYRLPLFY